jgi:hypothetical protein
MKELSKHAEQPHSRPAQAKRHHAASCVYNRHARRWEAHFGDLGEDARRRMAALLRTSDEFGTQLQLSAMIAPAKWREPVLPCPVPLRPFQTEQHDYIDPEGATTMLVIDVNARPGRPVHHWWLSAEPPMGHAP